MDLNRSQLQVLQAVVAISFIVLSFSEALFYKITKRKYDYREGLLNFFIGLGSVAGFVLIGSISHKMYALGNQYRLFTIPNSWATIIVLLFLEDYVYYWFHRFGHERNIFWAAHEVHHSANTMNFSVALRETWTGFAITWIFWWPLFFIGFSPENLILQQTISYVFQFLVHSEFGSSFGFFGLIFSTPSHHRVHHGRNPQYLDKNYGAIFILWDRLHGTFVPEIEPPDYGTVKRQTSTNPFYLALHVWKELIEKLFSSSTTKQKLIYIFGAPGHE